MHRARRIDDPGWRGHASPLRLRRKMLFSGKLNLVANTLPLFTVAQMSIMSSRATEDKDSGELITEVFKLIELSI